MVFLILEVKMTVIAYNYQSLTMSCKLQGIAFFEK